MKYSKTITELRNYLRFLSHQDLRMPGELVYFITNAYLNK